MINDDMGCYSDEENVQIPPKWEKGYGSEPQLFYVNEVMNIHLPTRDFNILRVLISQFARPSTCSSTLSGPQVDSLASFADLIW